MSFASVEPLALEKSASRSGTVSFFFSSPEMSTTTRPASIMMRRLPCAMASFMLCVIISVVSRFSCTIWSESASTLAAVLGSSAAVCSSSSSSFGCLSEAISSVSA